jgi:hypothetical protein
MRGFLLLAALLAASPALADKNDIPPLRIYEDGSRLPTRFSLNFIGAGVTCADNSTTKRTDCTVTGGGGGGGYDTIANAGTPVTQRSTFNFDGNIVATDNPGATRTDITLGAAVMLTGATQTVTGAKTFNSSALVMNGTGGGTTTIASAAVGTRTVTWPDSNGTIVLQNSTQTLTNKTLDGGSNTFTNIAQASITDLTTDLAAKAADSAVVHLAGTESITGAKTFDTGTLKVNNAGGTAATTLATVATSGRTWTLPDASDTAVGLAATQELTNKTLTGQIIKNGLTASGSTANDFSGSTGDFTFPTGSLAWTGASNKTISLTAQGASGTVAITAGTTTTVKGGGVANPIAIFDTTAGLNSVDFLVFKNNGSTIGSFLVNVGTPTQIQLRSTTTSSPNIYNVNIDGLRINNGFVDFLVTGNPIVVINSAGIRGQTASTQTSGTTTHPWASTASRSYFGVQQAVSSNGSITINPTLGETYRLISSGNVTGLTLSAGTAGQIITLIFVSGNVSHTWVGTITNCRLEGGSFTKTTTLNAVDTLTFRWNSTDSKWDEIGRAINIS